MRDYVLGKPCGTLHTSTHTTSFVISLSDPAAYAILATLADPSIVTLPTSTMTRGQIRQQIAAINLTSHLRSMLGRSYGQLLTDPDNTQLNTNILPLHYNHTKGLIGRPNGKMTWATPLLAHTDVLHAY